MVGLPPSGEEVLRGLVFLIVTVAYGGVWLAIAMLFSVIFKNQATAALASLAVWLVFALFWSMLAPLLAEAFGSQDPTPLGELARVELQQSIARVSPNVLFGEATLAILNPATRALGPVLFSQLQGALLGSPLPFAESIMLIWPQITGLIAAVIVMFTIAYVLFQRQEIRA